MEQSAIETTVVGVAVFSLTLKSKVITAKMQMSSPEPANEVKIPKFKGVFGHFLY
jgi:hypothetical protein